jgi:hypothetical protein
MTLVFRTDRADGERSADRRRWVRFNVKSEVASEPSAMGARPGFRAANRAATAAIIVAITALSVKPDIAGI